MVHLDNLLPVEGIVTTITATERGNMVSGLEGGVEQAIGYMAQLTLPGRTRKNSAFMAALTL